MIIYPGVLENPAGLRWAVFARPGLGEFEDARRAGFDLLDDPEAGVYYRSVGTALEAIRLADELARANGWHLEVPPYVRDQHMRRARELISLLVRGRCQPSACVREIYSRLLAAGVQPHQVVAERLRLEQEVAR